MLETVIEKRLIEVLKKSSKLLGSKAMAPLLDIHSSHLSKIVRGQQKLSLAIKKKLIENWRELLIPEDFLSEISARWEFPLDEPEIKTFEIGCLSDSDDLPVLLSTVPDDNATRYSVENVPEKKFGKFDKYHFLQVSEQDRDSYYASISRGTFSMLAALWILRDGNYTKTIIYKDLVRVNEADCKNLYDTLRHAICIVEGAREAKDEHWLFYHKKELGKIDRAKYIDGTRYILTPDP
jgi:hypothetical protein